MWQKSQYRSLQKLLQIFKFNFSSALFWHSLPTQVNIQLQQVSGVELKENLGKSNKGNDYIIGGSEAQETFNQPFMAQILIRCILSICLVVENHK